MIQQSQTLPNTNSLLVLYSATQNAGTCQRARSKPFTHFKTRTVITSHALKIPLKLTSNKGACSGLHVKFQNKG